jgi:hypothetical protein
VLLLHVPFRIQVERLACGLLHEPSLAVAALDTSSKEAAEFAQRILGVTSLPAVLLYPEASPGFLRYAGEATTWVTRGFYHCLGG